MSTDILQVRRFSWKARGRSFGYAWRGVVAFFRTEHNAYLHLASAIFVLLVSLYLAVSMMEAVVLIFSVCLVWITEMLNTAIEKTVDLISEEHNPRIAFIKDVAAGAVLVSAAAAVVMGAIIFYPKIINLIYS
jgi:diacylglycerol kinase